MAISLAKVLNYMYLGSGWARIALRNLLIDRRVKILALIGAILNIITWVAVIILVRFLGDEQAILHYNILFGIDLIGSAARLFFMPVSGTVILIANLLLAASLAEAHDRALPAMFSAVALLANILILLAIYFIYLINFS